MRYFDEDQYQKEHVERIADLLGQVESLTRELTEARRGILECQTREIEAHAAIRDADACTYSGDILHWRKKHAAVIRRAMGQ